MKSFIKATKISREQSGIKFYFVELDSEIPQIWLTLKSKLTFEQDAILDNLNEYLIKVAEKRLEESPMFYSEDWQMKSFNKFQLATFLASNMFEAMQLVSEDGKFVFTTYIDEAKDKLKEYQNKNNASLRALQDIEEKKTKEEAKTEIEIQTKAPEIDYDRLADAIASRMPQPVHTSWYMRVEWEQFPEWVTTTTNSTWVLPSTQKTAPAKRVGDAKIYMGHGMVDVEIVDPSKVKIPLRRKTK